MSDIPPAGRDPRPPTPSQRRTVSRPVGLVLSAVTAFAVFGIGSVLWPSTPVVPAPTVAVVPQPPAAVAPRPESTDDATVAAVTAPDATTSSADTAVAMVLPVTVPPAAEDGGAKTSTESDASNGGADPSDRHADSATEDESSSSKRGSKRRRRERALAAAKAAAADGGQASGDALTSTDSKHEIAAASPTEATTGAGAKGDSNGKDATPADCALPEKDMARESWRRNWPAICPLASSGKAFILIPIKGSIEGESHALLRRPTREARVILPAGSESLLTMKQYKVRRLGFKELRVNSTEDGGTRLRVKLQPGAGDPIFEVKDGYVKITVAPPSKP